MAAWNACAPSALPIWRELTPKRRKLARQRLRERRIGGPDGWAAVIRRIAESSFCRGDVPPSGSRTTPWRATPDWLLRPDTATRVLEGQYDDPEGPSWWPEGEAPSEDLAPQEPAPPPRDPAEERRRAEASFLSSLDEADTPARSDLSLLRWCQHRLDGLLMFGWSDELLTWARAQCDERLRLRLLTIDGDQLPGYAERVALRQAEAVHEAQLRQQLDGWDEPELEEPAAAAGGGA